MRTTRKIFSAALGATAMLALVAGPALADGSASGSLNPVVGSGNSGSGTAKITVTGNTVSFTLAASGLLAGSPHAAHIHFADGARHSCPVIGDDTNKDGHINTTEGGPAYGAIVVSLTKTGDTTPASGLAIDRFDTAAGGNISYMRGDVTVTPAVAKAIEAGQSVVVVHGNDYNKDGKYSGTVKSDLDPKLPTEATDPALCGVVSASPAGGMATGQGGAAGGTDSGLIALGSIAVLGAAGVGFAATRRRRVEA